MTYINIVIVLVAAFVALSSAANTWEPEQNDATWVKHHETLLQQTKQHGKDVQVVFLGDSITEGWKWWGKSVWDARYAHRHAYNYGIAGDRTQNILWRIAHGEFDGLNPKLVVLMIGTNNIGTTSANIAKGVQAILDALRKKLPNSKILLLSLLPRAPVNEDTKIHEVNQLISRFADNKAIHYLDLAVHFELGLGHEKTELYTSDHLHIDVKGYELWYKTMEPSYLELSK